MKLDVVSVHARVHGKRYVADVVALRRKLMTVGITIGYCVLIGQLR